MLFGAGCMQAAATPAAPATTTRSCSCGRTPSWLQAAEGVQGVKQLGLGQGGQARQTASGAQHRLPHNCLGILEGVGAATPADKNGAAARANTAAAGAAASATAAATGVSQAAGAACSARAGTAAVAASAAVRQRWRGPISRRPAAQHAPGCRNAHSSVGGCNSCRRRAATLPGGAMPDACERRRRVVPGTPQSLRSKHCMKPASV